MGIILGLYFKESIAFIIGLIFIIYISKLLLKNKYIRYLKLFIDKKTIVIVVITVIVSSLYTIYINNKYEKFYISASEKINICGIIISEKEECEFYDKYIIKSISENTKGKRFIVYINKDDIFNYGDLIKIEGIFSEPDEARNYKGFNYKEYLKCKKIYGSIKAQDTKIIANNKINVIFGVSNKIRNSIIQKIKNLFTAEESGILIGLILGNKSYISEENIENFKKSSLSHILAVSGAHISYIILGTTYFINKSKIPKKIGYILTILILIFFMFITNFTPSVVRACLMGITMLFSKVIYRKSDTLNAIALSLLILTIYNPFIIKDIGLKLSYMGTLGIIMLNKEVLNFCINNLKFNKKISEILSVTISAQIFIAPIMALNFNTFSLTFFISNMLITPLFGTCMILGIITILISFIFFPLSKLLAVLLKYIIKLIILIASIVSKIPLSTIYVITPNILIILIYYLIIFFLIKFPKLKNKIFKRKNLINFSKIILIIIVLILIYKSIPKNLQIFFIDVGQRR